VTIIPADNEQGLTLDGFDDLTFNTLVKEGGIAMDNFITNLLRKHLFSKGQPAPQELYTKLFFPCQAFFTFILKKYTTSQKD
tara:strand:- start:433 stop:678 length:246 start_codon:yes stop_codon:yes gene_type:complete